MRNRGEERGGKVDWDKGSNERKRSAKNKVVFPPLSTLSHLRNIGTTVRLLARVMLGHLLSTSHALLNTVSASVLKNKKRGLRA